MIEIPYNQNDPKQLNRLAAQRYLYSRAKTYMMIQVILTIPGVMVLAVLTKLYPELRLWNAFYGAFASLIDVLFLDPFHNHLKGDAAKIQEEFDCSVLWIEWSEALAGKRSDPEIIHDASSKYKRTDPVLQKLKNWYPEIDNRIPKPLARILCQRANLRWDSHLRRTYAFWLAVLLGFFSLIIVAISMWNELTFNQFMLGGFCLLSPFWLWSVREYKRQINSANEIDRLKDYLESIWQQALQGQVNEEGLKDQSREIQNAILERRRHNPMIFDSVYNRLRNRNEEAMVKGTNILVEEFLKSDLL